MPSDVKAYARAPTAATAVFHHRVMVPGWGGRPSSSTSTRPWSAPGRRPAAPRADAAAGRSGRRLCRRRGQRLGRPSWSWVKLVTTSATTRVSTTSSVASIRPTSFHRNPRQFTAPESRRQHETPDRGGSPLRRPPRASAAGAGGASAKRRRPTGATSGDHRPGGPPQLHEGGSQHPARGQQATRFGSIQGHGDGGGERLARSEARDRRGCPADGVRRCTHGLFGSSLSRSTDRRDFPTHRSRSRSAKSTTHFDTVTGSSPTTLFPTSGGPTSSGTQGPSNNSRRPLHAPRTRQEHQVGTVGCSPERTASSNLVTVDVCLCTRLFAVDFLGRQTGCVRRSVSLVRPPSFRLSASVTEFANGAEQY